MTQASAERSAVWDVAVVGGGLAGSVAAVRAGQSGARVIVFEAAAHPLGAGNTLMTSGSLKAAGVSPFTAPEELVARVMAHGRANPALTRAWAASCAPAIQWLRALGIAVEPDKTGHHWMGDGSQVAAAPSHITSVGPAVIARLREELGVLGGALRSGARVRGLVRAPGERLTVELADGGRLVARAVVLATGGFAANPELLAAHLGPSSVRAKLRGAAANRGDGLVIALANGGRVINTEYIYGHLLCYGALTDDALWPYPRLDEVLPDAILVDRSGHRFLDEGTGDVAISNALARHPDPLGATLVFDARAWGTRGAIRHHPRLPPPNEAIRGPADGLFAGADAAELATALSIDPDALARELTDVNAWQAGVGRRLTVPRSADGRLIETPLYGLRVVPGLTFTAGGIQVDADAAVVGDDDRPPAGLFAAGDAIGGLMGGPRGGYHGGLMQALTTGLLSGAGAARVARASREALVGT